MRATQSTTRIDAPSLPEDVASVGLIGGEWLAVACAFDLRGSREAAAAWAVYLAGLPFYYPQRIGWVVQGDKRRRKKMSLFPGYLFVGVECEKWCRESDLIIDVLHEVRQDDLRSDLLLIEHALLTNPALMSTEVRSKGQRVRVTGGAYRGHEGIVEEIRKEGGGVVKVDVLIKTLGQCVPMEILRDYLEAVTPPGALVVR